jgi:hypothetical protein
VKGSSRTGSEPSQRARPPSTAAPLSPAEGSYRGSIGTTSTQVENAARPALAAAGRFLRRNPPRWPYGSARLRELERGVREGSRVTGAVTKGFELAHVDIPQACRQKRS